MKTLLPAVIAACAAAVVCAGPARADDGVVRELLRQQSAAEGAGCAGVQRVLAGGADAALVVRTAVELGYSPCLAVRCALERQAQLAKVVAGAIAAGVQPDVVTRCSVEAGADPKQVAAVLAEALLEPSYCYFAPQPATAPDPLPAAAPVLDRAYPRPQASPFAP